MTERIKSWLGVMMVFFVVAGCATSHYRRGTKALRDAEYDAAIAAFKDALKQNPRDARATRDLGIALYKKGSMDIARAALEKAEQLNPKDGLTLFYLGVIYEQYGKYAEAIDKYRRYTEATPEGGAKKAIKARLAFLIRQRIEQEVQAALAQESQLDLAAIPENTVAVLYFRNLGSNRDLDPLQKGLTDMLITDLSQVKALRVIERARLQSLLEEMGLGMTGLVDEATAPRVGKLLGTRELVLGSFLDLSPEQLRVDAGLVKTIVPEPMRAEEVSGPLTRFFRIEKDLVFKVLDRMGITPTPEERDAILHIPTENLLAFLAYSKGLDYEDRGMFREAEAAYREAIQLDPHFAPAQEGAGRVEGMATAPLEIRPIEAEVWRTSQALEAPLPTPPLMPTFDRLFQSSVNTGAGFGVLGSGVPTDQPRSNDVRQPTLEETGSFGRTGEIRIVIPLPQ